MSDKEDGDALSLTLAESAASNSHLMTAGAGALRPRLPGLREGCFCDIGAQRRRASERVAVHAVPVGIGGEAEGAVG